MATAHYVALTHEFEVVSITHLVSKDCCNSTVISFLLSLGAHVVAY